MELFSFAVAKRTSTIRATLKGFVSVERGIAKLNSIPNTSNDHCKVGILNHLTHPTPCLLRKTMAIQSLLKIKVLSTVLLLITWNNITLFLRIFEQQSAVSDRKSGISWSWLCTTSQPTRCGGYKHLQVNKQKNV